MATKFKKKTVVNSFGTNVCIGTIISVLLSIILEMILAAMVVNERIEERSIAYLTPIIMLVSSLIGCIEAGKRMDEKIGIVISVTGLIYLFVLVGTGILLFDGGFHNLLLSLISIVIGCVLSCAICIRGKGNGGKRKRAYG